jgi:hypothetical protein
MVYLFDAEATSIRKTRQLANAGKVGCVLKYCNLLREILALLTMGTALWQIFSANPYPDPSKEQGEDEELPTVVDEIMNFAALLIVIELDDFLMASPGEQQCKQFYGDDFLAFEFTRAEIQNLAYKGLPIKHDKDVLEDKLSCCEKFTNVIEWLIALVFKFAIFFIIIIVNL